MCGITECLTYDPDVEGFCAAATNPARLLSVDPVTGSADVVGAMTLWFRVLAYDGGSDALYGVAGASPYTMDRFTGIAGLVGPLDISGAVTGPAIHPLTRVLYAAVFAPGQLLVVD